MLTISAAATFKSKIWRTKDTTGKPRLPVSIHVRKGNNKDINGDGFPDLLTGAPDYNSVQGRVYIFHTTGSAGISSTGALSANTIFTGENLINGFGGVIAQ